MAYRGDTSSPEIQFVLVETDLDTQIGIILRNNETVFDIKEKIYKEHKECYPEVGEIKISTLKIKRRGHFFRVADSVILSKAFAGIGRNGVIYVDAVRVEKNELMTIMAADQNRSDPELLEKKESAIESVLVDEHMKDMTSKEVLESGVAEKTTKKRKLKSVDHKGSRKNPSVDLNQTGIATTASRYAVDESHDLCVKAQVEVVASESGQKDDIRTEEVQQTSVADSQEKILAIDADLVDEHTEDMTSKEVLESGVAEKTTKKRKLKSVDRKGSRKNPSVDLTQKAIATTASRYAVDESHDLCVKAQVEVVASESGQKNDIRMEENQQTSVADSQEKILTVDADPVDEHTRGEVNDVQSDQSVKETQETELAMGKSNVTDESHKPENIKQDLEKGEKSAEVVRIDQEKNLAFNLEPVDGHITSSDAVNESHEVCEEVRVGVSAEDGVILPREKLDDLLSGPLEKEHERGEGSRLAPNAADNPQTTDLVTNPENQLEATEKKKKRKKNTKDQRKIVDEITGTPEKQLEASSGLKTGPAIEEKKKKKKRARSSKDLIDQSAASTTTSKEIVNDREKVSASMDCVDATSESFPNLKGETPADALQNENEVGEKVVDKVGSGEATIIDAVKIQSANNLQVIDSVITPHVLVEESKTLDQVGKIMEENKALEHDTIKDNVDEAKYVKSSKRKTSKKAKTPAKEDTPVVSGAQNVELTLGEGPDNVIRNVLDSLQERNETQENLDKTGKKTSSKSKKKQPSKTESSRGSADVSLSSVKPKETNNRLQPASSGTSQLKSRVKNDRIGSKVNHSDASMKAVVNNKKEDVKKTSNTLMVNKSKLNFFKDAENSSDDESKQTSHVSAKTSSYSSSDDDSDVTSNSRNQGNNTAGGTKRFLGSLQDILRSSKSYKKAKLAADSQSQDVFEDESPALDFVPDSQAN